LSLTFPDQTWKMPGIFSKSSKTIEFYLKTWKNRKFLNLVFQDSVFKMSFYKKTHFHLGHIYFINSNTVIRSQKWPGISSNLPRKNMENTWNFLSPEKWEPWKAWHYE
jgi:hypothetical protein